MFTDPCDDVRPMFHGPTIAREPRPAKNVDVTTSSLHTAIILIIMRTLNQNMREFSLRANKDLRPLNDREYL
jgi:hypothetical protein